MPRIDKSMFKSSSGPLQIGSERTTAEEALEVMVFQTDADLFVSFVSDVYDSIESQYQAANAQRPLLPFTKDDFVRYAFTGMRARLMRVNNESNVRVGTEQFRIRCDDPWQMPSIIAAILNSVGRVSMESPVITVVPVWNPLYDEFVMSQRDWFRVTQLIRGVAKNEYMKVVLVNSLSGDKSGDEALLSLIPVRDEVGRVVRISHREQAVDPIAAAVYIIAGFDPEIYAGVNLGLHPLLLPPYYITVGAVRQNLWRLTDVA
jgi:hypothetical protein